MRLLQQTGGGVVVQESGRHELRLAPALRTLGKDSSSALSLAYVVRETVGLAQ